ncbi:MAG: citrate lyase acyl carrier protein [Synergistetes bacterium]|nr:citrate lyase acyl carrier protein [Synergistota bacterium]MDW8191594.1 citrate lyase acyl carrier protein [Synergistota bacterium]
MEILREAVAGSLESCDCLVMVKPYETLKVDIESVVMERYGRRIKQIVEDTIRELGIVKGYFKVQDRGALDYCIRARLKSAIRRANLRC